MCLGIPGRVVEMADGYADQVAMVDVLGKVRQINVGMLETAVSPGDWLLIHMGFAVELVDQAAAEKALAGLEMMGRARDEVAPT
jgi:hydrogenase assembly chaperone HypC/HupF